MNGHIEKSYELAKEKYLNLDVELIIVRK